ncbi:endonuclease/exonuclease/phosphatase family protein [Nonomuraea sp. KC401]|uniref:endonuclease/exonuclease/phosphatase family protein n=1 Tax=unclassified Nonomuraea TaxID=2593643 RepID=UPI0010FE6812|nr:MULTISPECIES: endonuclease/exonuclease/phosphatase family protein [unclassified Nonomuraea]NBE96006.1 endonuclease/exonuclease/phosphatase family protein [Nonomuraea sp. K271]TLF64926.1 endonuclease/exonuclease/phosphatase family protein [Nonomuraea sp. KC401]
MRISRVPGFGRLLWTVAAFLVTTAALQTAPAPAASSATATYKIWHWNMAGHHSHLGSTTNGIIQAIAGSISYRNPDFVSINEICRNQYSAVIDVLQGMGWPQNATNFARYEPVTAAGDPGYCAGHGIGIAIFSRFALGETLRQTLPYDGSGKQRKLLCSHVAARPGTRFCTTHLTTVAASKSAQLGQVHGVLESYRSRGDVPIIAGDFNVQPDSPLLDTWYDATVNTDANHGNTGRYHELDDREAVCPGWGEQTTESNKLGACGQSGKVDLIFVPAERLARYSADAHPIGHVCGGNRDKPCSDHRIVDATVSVTTGK